MVNERRVGHAAWVVHFLHLSMLIVYEVADVRNCRDDIHVKFPVESLLHNLHVEQSEESASETKAEGSRALVHECERSVVEL